MQISRGAETFEPVVLVLETEAEFQELYHAMYERMPGLANPNRELNVEMYTQIDAFGKTHRINP